jgi:hypothetical protein
LVKRLLALTAALLAASICYSDQIAVSKFRGLNANENAAIIDPEDASDLLNIDVTPGGKSIAKRPGYGLYKTLSTSQALHGGFHFFDSSGNDVQLWASSTSIYGIVSDAAPAQIVSSMTLNSTIDCADTQGSAYCVSSNRDFYIKTNGATLSSWAITPLGTIVEATPDRVVVAGVSGTLNTIYHSGSNTFNTYTTGPLATDPFTEVIAAPGSKITHLRWACGKLLWWKDQSFGYESFEDQYSLQIKIISDNIGTVDNTSAVDPGGNVWFRGQDGHIWKYDCSGLTKESIEISPLVQSSSRRTSNQWIQTSQSDWQTGSSSPTIPTQPLSFMISAGDVVPGSYTVTENSSSQWNSGTASGMTISASSYTITTGSAPMPNPDFEQNSGASTLPTSWTRTGASGAVEASHLYSGIGCTLSPEHGSWMAGLLGGYSASTDYSVAIWRASDDLGLSTTTIATCTAASCSGSSWLTGTVAAPASLGTSVKLVIKNTFANFYLKSSAFTLAGDISFKYFCTASDGYMNFDDIQASISTGTFISQAFNTSLPYSFVFTSATWSSGSSVPAFVLQRSVNGSNGWYDVNTTTGTNTQIGNRYIRYVSTMTLSAYGIPSQVTGVNLIAMSSGTYYSAVKNTPLLSAYSTFNPTYSNGGGSHAFYVRASVLPFNVITSTGPPWTAQPANALIASTFTASYIQFIDSFTITSATDTPPSLSDFTANYFDGTATDQAYMLYFDDAIWSDVAYGTGVSSNTYIFKNDRINDAWTLYNFGAGGMLVQNNHLFFGDVAATGKIFQYDSGHSDAGNAINAFWKTKEFTGQDPFLQNSLLNIDTFAKKDAGSTLTATYALDTSTTTTSYNISLSSGTSSTIQNRKLLPVGKQGYTFDFKLGDSSDSSNWEIFGIRIGYIQQPYRPTQ